MSLAIYYQRLNHLRHVLPPPHAIILLCPSTLPAHTLLTVSIDSGGVLGGVADTLGNITKGLTDTVGNTVGAVGKGKF
jgi:hypothetical protein